MLAVPAFSQVGPGPNATTQLPSNFQSTVQQDYYSQEPLPEVSFDLYYYQSAERYFQSAAIAADPSIKYPPIIVTPVPQSPCDNGNFEAGTIAWTGGYGSVLPTGVVDYPTFVTGISSGPINLATSRQTIVNAGPDPNVPMLSMVAPGGGINSLRLGNRAAGRGAELISKTFIVTAANANLTFWYAVVLQTGGTSHAPNRQASFKVNVRNAGGGLVVVPVNLGPGTVGDEIMATPGNPAFTGVVNNNIYYRDWTCGQIDLTSMMGQIVTVEFVTKDCALSGHWGYAYLDNLCTPCTTPPQITPGSITLGTGTSCGKGSICVNYTLPSTATGATGSVVLTLRIIQNGVIITTLISPTLTSGSTYCFPIDPATIAGLNTTLGGFDYQVLANFNMGTPATATIGTVATGIDNTVNNDYKINCGCCPGSNIIVNPQFESGNTGFTSAFVYQALVAANSVTPGRYGIMTSAQANTVCASWKPNCPADNLHMVVNGATGTPGTKLVWRQTVTIQRGVPYKFCADFKNMPACCFDVKPKVTINFSEPGFNISSIIDVPAGTCNWKTLTQSITLPGTGTVALTIDILLDQSSAGDGNDLALDNISLVQVTPLPLSEVIFNLNYTNPAGTNITATPVNPLGVGCSCYWEVAELDAAGNPIPGTQVINPPSWPCTGPNNFAGYNGTNVLSGTAPGLFDINKRYRIVYARWCECRGWVSYAIILNPNAVPGVPRTAIVDETYQMSAERIREIMSGEIRQTPVPEKGSLPATATDGQQDGGTSSIRVFPNPTEDKITVVIPAAFRDVQLKLMTPSGQVLKTVPVRAGETSVTLSMKELVSGVYLLQATSQNRAILNEKVIKL